MSFLFVDKILDSKPGISISGLKHITLDDDYLMPSSNNRWQLMPSIIGEALGQLGAWNVIAASDFSLRPVAGVVSAVHMHDEAFVGESLLLETTIDSWDSSAIEYHSLATVDGRKIFTIESALGPMMPMTDFINKEDVIRQYNEIFRPSNTVIPSSMPSFLRAPPSSLAHAHFDSVISNTENEVVALKKINRCADYFRDHFPNKPVLPLTILLNCKLALATDYILGQDQFSEKTYKPISVRKIKMNGFVQPGDVLSTCMKIKPQDNGDLLFRYRSEVDGRRVCVAEALFQAQS